jgi:hypothetical protein
MNKTKLTLSVLATFLFIITCATAGQATSPRTFVSGSGSDSNAPGCTFTLPCRFLSTAYANTDIGGEVIALTTAGYGGLAINHAITVEALPGQFGFISVVAGSAGISVGAGATEGVVIRNFQFSATPTLAAGSVGIQHTSGKLVVENCTFTNLVTGINVSSAKMDIINCDMFGNSTGLHATGHGTDGQNEVSTTLVRMSFGNITANGVGIQQDNPGRNSNNNQLSNVFVLSVGTGGTLNLTGNTTNGACTDAIAGCLVIPATYSMGQILK